MPRNIASPGSDDGLRPAVTTTNTSGSSGDNDHGVRRHLVTTITNLWSSDSDGAGHGFVDWRCRQTRMAALASTNTDLCGEGSEHGSVACFYGSFLRHPLSVLVVSASSRCWQRIRSWPLQPRLCLGLIRNMNGRNVLSAQRLFALRWLARRLLS